MFTARGYPTDHYDRRSEGRYSSGDFGKVMAWARAFVLAPNRKVVIHETRRHHRRKVAVLAPGGPQ